MSLRVIGKGRKERERVELPELTMVVVRGHVATIDGRGGQVDQALRRLDGVEHALDVDPQQRAHGRSARPGGTLPWCGG